MAPPKDIVSIDLVSPEPEERPKMKVVIDLTKDGPEIPVRKPTSKANVTRPNKPSLSRLTPPASSSSKDTPSRPHASSISRSAPSSSTNAAVSSRRLTLGERDVVSPAITDSPESSQPTRKDPNPPASKPRFRISSPVSGDYPASNSPNPSGLERQKQGLASPATKTPQLKRPRNEPDSDGSKSGISQPEPVAPRPQSKEARSEPRSKPETIQLQHKSVAPESKQSNLGSTRPQSKETQSTSPQSKPHGTRPLPKEARPEKSRSNLESLRNSISPEAEQPRRNILQPRGRLSQPATRVTTPLAPTFDEDFDGQLNTTSPDSQARELLKEGGKLASGVSAGGPSTRSNSSSRPSSRVRNQVDSYNLKVLSGTAQHTSRRHFQSPRGSRRNSIPANGPPVEADVNIEEILRSFKKEMETNHAFNVHFLLEDASETAFKAQVQSRFIDKVSPFASMKSIESDAALAKAPNSHVFKTLSSDQKNKGGSSTTYTMSKRIVPDYELIPRYTSLTFFHRNLLSPDDERLRSMPQENEQTKKGKALEEELKKAYSYRQKEETSSETEYRKRLHVNVDFWLEEGNIQCTKHDLEKYLITRQEFGIYIKEKQKGLMRAYKKASPLITKLKTQLNEELCKLCGSFDMAFKGLFDIPLCEVLLSTKRIKELLEMELYKTSRRSMDHSQPAAKGPMFAVETYTNLICLICGALDCQTHGEFSAVTNYDHDEDNEANEEEDNEKETDIKFLTKPERITIQAQDLLRKVSERRANMNATRSGNETKRIRAPCSSDCHLVVGAGSEVSRLLTEGDISDINLMLFSLSYKHGRCCDIAFSLSIPCCQVFREIDRQEQEHMQIDLIPHVALSKAEIEKHRPSWYDNKERKLKGEWQAMTMMHLHEEMTQAEPCHHAGPCSKDTNCECFRKSILCEDICSCSDDCPRRFTGCACRSSGKLCEKDSCICIQLNRECGPHCLCGALERLNPANRYNDDLFAKGCQNCVIQRNVPKATIAGTSQIAGHGLYVGEFIPKNSYIDEYVGELISHGEADRRGVIYDHNFVSFLFDLNHDWVLDGHYLGNKTRFINHASSPEHGQNCQAKILWVNGEHRIKFFALRDIDAGEELLFDYGKEFAAKHGLNLKLPKSKALSRKAAGTVVKSEGRSKTRTGRGSVASRGGHGRSTGRARKHQLRNVVVDEDEDED